MYSLRKVFIYITLAPKSDIGDVSQTLWVGVGFLKSLDIFDFFFS